MKENNWLIPSRKPNSLFSQRINERDDSRSSFKVKFCNKCQRSYERFWEDSKSELRYYDDFVTIGLERKVCERCEDK